MKCLSLILTFVVCTCLTSTNNVFAQARELQEFKGKVVNQQGVPLSFVHISVPGTLRGTISIAEGNFHILAKDKETIRFSYVGMKDTLIQLDKNKTSELLVQMEQEILQLDDVRISKERIVEVEDIEDLPDDCYETIEQNPEFPGGRDSLNTYVKQNLQYPEEAFQAGEEGQVIIEFTIGKDGCVSNAQVTKSVSASLDKEALRIVRSFPRWTPGAQRGRPVEVRISLPIDFVIDLSHRVKSICNL